MIEVKLLFSKTEPKLMLVIRMNNKKETDNV